MNSMNYLLQANLYLILFMGFYSLVLRNETFFRQNRIFLNGSVLLSFVIPFINSGWFRDLFITQKVREAVPLQLIYDPVMVQVSAEAPGWTFTDVMFWIYVSGTILFLTRFFIQLIWLNYNLKEKKGSAFSFFKKLVVDEDLLEKETIIAHEKVHIRQWHSADIILTELAAIINWFNPVVYLYKKEIRHIHEFIADEEASSAQISKSDYAVLLLSNTLGINPHQLTNSFFNQSLLKRRIIMLNKNRSPRTGLLKYGLCAPLFAIMLIFSAATVSTDKAELILKSKKITSSLMGSLAVTDEPDDYKSFLKRNPTVKELAWQINPYRVIVYLKNGKSEIYTMDKPREKQNSLSKYGDFPYPPPPPPTVNRLELPPPPPMPPEVATDLKVLYKHLGKSIKYPESARENQITGYVVAGFSVENNSIRNIKVIKTPGYGLEEEVIKSLSTFNGPLFLGSGPHTIGIGFQISGSSKNILETKDSNYPNYLGDVIVTAYSSKSAISTDNSEEKPVTLDKVRDFASVEVLPLFPGGEKGFYAFLSQNIKYPAEAKEKNISGRVFVTYIVEKDGSLADIKVLRGLGYGTDEEAVRVLKLSPNWIPGITNGQHVRVQYTIPILFSLNSKTSVDRLQKTEIVPLVILDGKEISYEEMKKIPSGSIKLMNVLKDKSAVDKYGEKGKNGVIEISIK
ncbi:MAG TPA: TonB family protein [Sphingobacteriaceae bacterium]|nr:TonB family protein [Sphingobacteriaceae bacterium]